MSWSAMEINSQTDCITICYFLSHREEGDTRKPEEKKQPKTNQTNLGTDSLKRGKDKWSLAIIVPLVLTSPSSKVMEQILRGRRKSLNI